MVDSDATPTRSPTSITAAPNGPLVVTGGVGLYRRRAVQSEHGEPLAWETTERIEAGDRYSLCRCGESGRKPFCDGTHAKVGFEADDVASGSYDDRSTSSVERASRCGTTDPSVCTPGSAARE